jgi:hypothetical protein
MKLEPPLTLPSCPSPNTSLSELDQHDQDDLKPFSPLFDPATSRVVAPACSILAVNRVFYLMFLDQLTTFLKGYRKRESF